MILGLSSADGGMTVSMIPAPGLHGSAALTGHTALAAFEEAIFVEHAQRFGACCWDVKQASDQQTILRVTVSFSSVSVSAQDGIGALGKAHTRSAPSLSSLPKVALETVPIFAWLNTDRSRPLRVECRPLLFSTPLSFRRSLL